MDSRCQELLCFLTQDGGVPTIYRRYTRSATMQQLASSDAMAVQANHQNFSIRHFQHVAVFRGAGSLSRSRKHRVPVEFDYLIFKVASGIGRASCRERL